MTIRTNIENRDSLARYMGEIRKFPILDATTEAELAKRWRDHRDPDASERLAGSHLRLVIKVAKGYRGYGLPFADLVSEGNVGLMQAVDKFDPDRGVRLSTYAVWWIRAAIINYVLRTTSTVKMVTTEAHKKLFFNLKRLKSAHNALEDGDLAPETVTAIAHKLAVSEADVVRMDRSMSVGDRSLNAPIGSDLDGEWQDLLVDDSQDPEATAIAADESDKRRRLMTRMLDTLDDRERHILVERRLTEDPPTLAVLSEEYGISRERVRQIESRALAKLKEAMLKASRTAKLASEHRGQIEQRERIDA